jgi:hypothetical protein
MFFKPDVPRELKGFLERMMSLHALAVAESFPPLNLKEEADMKKVVRMCPVVVAAVVLISGMAGAAFATVVPQLPEQNVVGMTPGDLSAAWWQYVLAIPNDPPGANPAADTTGANCGVDQAAGPFFFLTGNFTSNATVTRNCTVPAGKTLIIPIVNSECSTLESPPFYGSNEKELRACAAVGIDPVDLKTLQLTIDGKQAPDLKNYRAQSPVYSFTLPANNILGLASGGTGFSVSDGFWAAVKPLSAGTHTVHFGGTIGSPFNFTVDVTYNLNVLK